MKNINWKKGLFSSKYKLFENNIEVGYFSPSAFSSTSIGKLKESKLKFRTKGFFSSETEIIDLNSKQLIGNIKFNSWRSKAEIKIKDKNYLWKYGNFWHSKWSISENGQQLVNYQSSTTCGDVEALIENNSLILCGFYVYNYYVLWMIIVVVLTAVIISGN